jgi:hypothetical protein
MFGGRCWLAIYSIVPLDDRNHEIDMHQAMCPLRASKPAESMLAVIGLFAEKVRSKELARRRQPPTYQL